MEERKTIYLCLAHMSEAGMEQKYVKEAFDTNWVVPMGPNVNAFEEDLRKFVTGNVESAVYQDSRWPEATAAAWKLNPALKDTTVVCLSAGTAAVHLALIGCGVKAKKVNKPMKGHFDKNNVAPKKVLKEFRLENIDEVNVGDILKADVFAAGDKVDVIGTSKGHGTAGVMKRWNFGRLRESHGTGPVARHAGSLGACSDPSRVYKGKKLAGHLGAERVTVQNLSVVKVDAENNLIAIKGAVPGPKGGIVVIKNSVKKA